jgi:hypothetical protein
MKLLLILNFVVSITAYDVHYATLHNPFSINGTTNKCNLVESFTVDSDDASRLAHCERTLKIFFNVMVIVNSTPQVKHANSFLQQHGFLTNQHLPKDHCIRTKM